jgi:hypothetical protein
MPQNLVTGKDAADVAAYVASVAGTKGYSEESSGGPAAVGGGDGKSVFASAGCGSCHTFQAAGSNGTIGPNLDEAKPPFELAIERVTNGKGAMPSFRDSLSDESPTARARCPRSETASRTTRSRRSPSSSRSARGGSARSQNLGV